MYDEIREEILFIILYAGVLYIALMASGYLLLRRGNAFAPGITPPVRLRRWTAAFFAVFVLNHVCYMPLFFLTSGDEVLMTILIGDGLLPVAGHRYYYIYGTRAKGIWPLAARQLCRPGA